MLQVDLEGCSINTWGCLALAASVLSVDDMDVRGGACSPTLVRRSVRIYAYSFCCAGIIRTKYGNSELSHEYYSLSQHIGGRTFDLLAVCPWRTLNL